jgi:TolB protein
LLKINKIRGLHMRDASRVTLVVTVFVLLCSLANAAVDTIYLEGIVSANDAIPIGIVAFEGDASALDEPPMTVLDRDLYMSGRFRTVKQSALDAKKLSKEGASYFIAGSIQKNAQNNYSIECRLQATHSLDLIAGQTYTVSAAGVRKALHDFADMVTWQLFGEQAANLTYLTFVSKRRGYKQIMVSDYDGFNVWQVTVDSAINTMPTWEPGAQSLVYVSFRNGRAQLFQRNLYTGKSKLLFSHLSQSFAPAVSPQGDEVLFTVAGNGSSNIHKGSIATGKTEQLTFHWSVQTSPDWSPNGREIIFTGDRSGGPQIHVMDKYGADTRRITYLGRYNESPAWSPQGDRIAYVSMDGNQMNIYTCDINGGNVTQLTAQAGNNESPSWSPDGRMIAFSSTRSGSSQIYIMRADGAGVTQISRGGSNSLPNWSGFTKRQSSPEQKNESQPQSANK